MFPQIVRTCRRTQQLGAMLRAAQVRLREENLMYSAVEEPIAPLRYGISRIPNLYEVGRFRLTLTMFHGVVDQWNALSVRTVPHALGPDFKHGLG